MNIKLSKPSSNLDIIAIILFGIFAFLLITNRAMLLEDNHDEHQFLASGYLLATKGLLPYRDYAYFHMPNLIFAYALIERLTTFRLLGARLFSALFGTLSVLTLSLSSYFLLKREKLRIRVGVALLAGLVLLANPIFAATSGIAFNHDLPVFLSLIGAIIFYQSKDQNRPFLAVGVSGLIFGFAIGTRLTFATFIPALIWACVIHPYAKSKFDYWKLIFALAVGGTVSMLPSIVLFAMAPRNFIFGNFIYASLNTLYRIETGYDDRMSFLLKLNYLINDIFTNNSNLLIFVALIIIILIPAWVQYREKKSWQFKSAFWAFLIIFGSIGSFLPTPAFHQYFYAPIPITLLGTIFNLIQFNNFPRIEKNTFLQFILTIIIISTLFGLKDTGIIANTFQAHKMWFPFIVHWRAEKLEFNTSAERPILTLNPFYVIEAGRDIYPELATGPFAYRVAHLVNQTERLKYKLIDSSDLVNLLSQNPPAGILIGRDPELESEMEDYAINHFYREVNFAGPFRLWVTP
ncbi:MAG: hypothetical protein HY864_17110 [Chloroflexi bacterium]|nr:hypothetical protein [Chloroflexota bacterium]